MNANIYPVEDPFAPSTYPSFNPFKIEMWICLWEGKYRNRSMKKKKNTKLSKEMFALRNARYAFLPFGLKTMRPYAPTDN